METKELKQPCWVKAPTTKEERNKLKSFLENRGIDTHFYSMYMDFGGLYVLKNNEIISEYSARERGGKSAIAAIKNTYPEMEVTEEEEEEYKFTPFEKVLARDDNSELWCCDFFSHLADASTLGCKFMCTGSLYYHCIPYKGNEHLLGTNNNPK